VIPILFEFKIFGWTLSLPTYGTLLAIAFLTALWVAQKRARRLQVDPNTVTDLWIASLIAGVIGSKLLLYLLNIEDYLAHPAAILTSLRSAGVFYGGLLAAIGVCVVLVRRRGLDGWQVGDVLAPAIALGQSIGRLGCFAAGCCWGRATSLPWAVTFTNPRAHEITGVPLGVPLHPTQIYLSLADLAAFGILTWVSSRRSFRGQIILLYLILYALLRGSIEALRDDPRGGFAGLSTSQILSILVGIAAAILYVWRARQPGAAVEAGPAQGRARAGRPRKRKEAPAP
jgi:phosphatidylglycerol:prolipoprotein diacylglycerol transferase